MKRFWKILATGIFLALPWLGAASAQQVNPYCTQSTAPPYIWAPCSPVNALAVTASVSASITGFPGATPTTGTPIAVTTGGVTGSLPAGAVVVASNVGATNGAYCKLGASSTTSDQLIPPNSWFAFTVGAATQLTCITSTSTTTVNMVGGSGLPTGSGGGGGGSGGGGAITAASGSYASGALASGSVASGAMVDLGSQADAACGSDNGSCSAIALIKRGNQNSTTLNATAGAAIATGTNPIGTVAIAPTAASGGWTHWSTASDNSNTALTTTVVAVKSSAAGKFGGYYISNTNATVACLQVFDVATAGGVTLGTTRPNMVYCIPATSAANMELVNGTLMANGIQVAATTTASGSSALVSGLDLTVYFK